MAIKSITATINGQAVTLTLNSATGKYEAQVNAPAGSSFNLSGGYYPVSLRAEDTAGNVTTADSTHSTLGESLRLFVKEQVKPTIEILAPSAGAYVTTGTPEIRFKVTDNTVQTSGYSGVKKSSCVLKIGSAAVDVSKITWSDTEGGFIGRKKHLQTEIRQLPLTSRITMETAPRPQAAPLRLTRSLLRSLSPLRQRGLKQIRANLPLLVQRTT